jgi:hypothetical protein
MGTRFTTRRFFALSVHDCWAVSSMASGG